MVSILKFFESIVRNLAKGKFLGFSKLIMRINNFDIFLCIKVSSLSAYKPYLMLS